jgi:YfiH family protein
MPAMLPAVSDEFEWGAASWGHMLRARALAHVPHGWTTRQLLLRGSPDEERHGWCAIARSVGLGAESLVRLRQVHGAEVYLAGALAPQAPPSADIVLTDRAERVVAVQVADCAPVLVAADDGRVVAAAHAGWRGTAADVAGVTVRTLERHFGATPAALSAAIGPSIGPCCYEVGDELVDAFATGGWGEEDVERWFVRRDRGKFYLDVWQANADQLVKAGVPRARVHVSRLCTACHLDWFCSYRREGTGAGRLAGFIRPQPFHV